MKWKPVYHIWLYVYLFSFTTDFEVRHSMFFLFWWVSIICKNTNFFNKSHPWKRQGTLDPSCLFLPFRADVISEVLVISKNGCEGCSLSCLLIDCIIKDRKSRTEQRAILYLKTICLRRLPSLREEKAFYIIVTPGSWQTLEMQC